MKKPLSLLAGLVFSTFLYAADEIKPNGAVNITLLAEITPQGQKINGLALEYPENVLSGSDLRQIYQVQTSLDNAEKESRSVLKAYVNSEPKTAALPKAGKFVIIELDTADKNAVPYSIKEANKEPMKFKTKEAGGKIVESDKVQAVRIPEFFANSLAYSVEQKAC